MIIPLLEVAYKNYQKVQEEEKQVEKFDASEDAFFLISYLINFIIVGIALFLCFRRNAADFNVGAVIVAFCCPFCYIVYALAVPFP